MSINAPKQLIEVALPLDDINAVAARAVPFATLGRPRHQRMARNDMNPALTRPLIEVFAALAGSGVQVICATHSLFVLREVEILLRQEQYRAAPHRFFALVAARGGVKSSQSGSFEDVDPIASLEADLEQSGRFMEDGMDDHSPLSAKDA